MAAQFLRASSQRLVNSAPPLVSTGYPLTVGCWVQMLSVSATTNVLWAFTDTASDNNYIRGFISSTEIVNIGAAAGSTAINSPVTTAFSVGAWNYVVFRAISATVRRIAALFPSGTIEHGGGAVTSRAPTSMDTISIGMMQSATPVAPCDALIAECWYTATDIQPGGLQLDNALMWQLAKYGPLAVPHIKNALIEYLPFDASLLGDKGDYYSSRGRRSWVNTNGVTLV